MRWATARERGGAIARRRTPARVTYVLQPRSETVDAPGEEETRGVELDGRRRRVCSYTHQTDSDSHRLAVLERQAAHDEGPAFRNIEEAPTPLSIKDRLFYSFIVRDGDRHSAVDRDFVRPVEARRDPNDRSIRDRVLQRSEVGDDDIRARDVREHQQHETGAMHVLQLRRTTNSKSRDKMS